MNALQRARTKKRHRRQCLVRCTVDWNDGRFARIEVGESDGRTSISVVPTEKLTESKRPGEFLIKADLGETRVMEDSRIRKEEVRVTLPTSTFNGYGDTTIFVSPDRVVLTEALT